MGIKLSICQVQDNHERSDVREFYGKSISIENGPQSLYEIEGVKWHIASDVYSFCVSADIATTNANVVILLNNTPIISSYVTIGSVYVLTIKSRFSSWLEVKLST